MAHEELFALIHAKSIDDKSDFPTKETFVSGEDLTHFWERALKVANGFWLSPMIVKDGSETSSWIDFSEAKAKSCSWHLGRRQKYVLSPDARIYHIRTVEDFIIASQMYGPDEKRKELGKIYEPHEQGYCPEDYYRGYYNSMGISAERYAFFANLYKKTVEESGFSQEEIDLINPDKIDEGKRGYRFFYEPDEKKEIVDPRHFIGARHAKRVNKAKFEFKYAISQLKFIMPPILSIVVNSMKTCSKEIKKRDYMFADNVIVFNKMRDAGYDGFYVHQKAIDEAKKLKKTEFNEYAFTVLAWWEVASVCIWSYKFAD